MFEPSCGQHRHDIDSKLEEERPAEVAGTKFDLRKGSEAGAVVFGGKAAPERTKHKSIAGLTSSQLRAIKRSGFDGASGTLADPSTPLCSPCVPLAWLLLALLTQRCTVWFAPHSFPQFAGSTCAR